MGMTKKQQSRWQRKKRVRSIIQGTAQRPRLSVFRSLHSVSVQVIDDNQGRTLLSACTEQVKKGTAMDKAYEVGVMVAKQCKEKKINELVFDRNGYKYHGKVKAVAEGVREGGIMM